ncbi:hypothetical protein Tco_0246585 [Tanacetum coccineum]
MVEPEKPLKKKDQIALDEELALRLHAEEQAKLEKERADEQLVVRLQAEEQEQFSIKEKSRMLVEMIAERKKFFATQRATEQRSKPPTKTQIRNRMCAYMKNIGGYKHNQLKGRSYEEFKSSLTKHINRHIEIVKDDEVVDAIPLATKPPMIVEYKNDKDGRMGYFKLIRADGSSKKYSSMIKMLQDIDREDLETL